MRKFKSVQQAQQFLGAHAMVYNLFNLGRHLVSASHCRNLRMNAFNSTIAISGSDTDSKKSLKPGNVLGVVFNGAQCHPFGVTE